VTSSPWTVRAAVFVVFATTWELVARWVDGLLFPSFSETVVALPQLLLMPGLWQAVWISHQAFLLGFAAAVALGIGTGLLMGRAPAADVFIDPYLTILLVTPMSALIPIIIMTIGLGLFARALVVLLFAVVVIAVNTRAGLRTLDPAWLEMARSFGASERQLWRSVLLPGALPALVTGLRLGLGRAFTGMVAVELLLVAAGVGRLLLEFQGVFNAGAVYALVLLLVVEAVLLLRGLSWLERRLTPWAYGAVTE
jgi:ABC-type nitrate/sulfonate/bicarbonate transport system permease component